MSENVPASIERILTMSRNRAKEAGAYEVARLTPGGFVLCIMRGDRLIATAGKDARQEELLGMAAAPALARALKKLMTAVEHNDKVDAETMARKALFAAGITLP